MLLWEELSRAIGRPSNSQKTSQNENAARTRRLPFDTRCAAMAKTGKRCRGKIRGESEFCLFHDPNFRASFRRRGSSADTRNRRRLLRLPDGYLRKLTRRPAIGEAMDRLYREVRLGLLTPEMGRVLFNILTRILDSGLLQEAVAPKSVARTKAARIRPKMEEILTRSERTTWRKAVANAPSLTFTNETSTTTSQKIALPAAS